MGSISGLRWLNRLVEFTQNAENGPRDSTRFNHLGLLDTAFEGRRLKIWLNEFGPFNHLAAWPRWTRGLLDEDCLSRTN